jgi:lipase chaperone LimK
LQLRRRFDHVLSARGVLTETQIGEVLLQQAAHLAFDASQREALRELFERYRRYLSSLGTLQVDSTSLPSVRAAHLARQQMRRAMLGAQVAEAFFAQDATEENYALARMEVMQDTRLSATARDARLEALRDQLPPQLRAMEHESRTLERLDARVRALGATASDPATVYAARAEVVGPDAARRLAELDAEEAAWTARMQALESERRRILEEAAGDAAGQQRALAGYLEEHFTPEEQLRARAYLSTMDARTAAANE